MVVKEFLAIAENSFYVSRQLVFWRLPLAHIGSIDGHAGTAASSVNVTLNLVV